MKRRGLAAGLFAAASLLLACSGPNGHRILTFLFDGVPPLRAPGPSDGGGTPGVAPLAPAVAIYREHGPYAAKICDGCHEPGRGNVLVSPPDQLCGRCHVSSNDRRFVHGPLNAGGCMVCHDPHGSSNPYLLVSATGEFCLRCHERRFLRPGEGHEAGGPSCTSCHEAHMSDRQYLLR